MLHLLLPPSGPLLLIVIGAILLKGRLKASGKKIIIAGILLIYLFSIPLTSNILIRPLENDHPPLQEIPEHATVIVVLTAGVKDLSHIGLGSFPGYSSIARLAHGLELLKRSDISSFIISGGKGDVGKRDVSIGRALQKTALSLGVPEETLIVEDRSRNTRESAQILRYLVNRANDHVILVTSAYHMRRSVVFFEKAGFRITPAPSDYKGEKIRINVHTFVPSSGALHVSSTALYEYLVRLRYWIF